MLTMDNKSMELLQQGKYFKALKNYVEVAAEESTQMTHYSDALPPAEGMQHQQSPRNSRQVSQRSSSLGTKSGNQGLLNPQTSLERQRHVHSMGPKRQRITKESIIKIDRNSSAGSVGLALIMIIVLLIIFFATL